MPVLFGEEPDAGERVLRARQAKRVLLLLPETRTCIRTDCRRHGNAPHQSAAVAVRGPAKQGDTDQRPAVHGQRVEVVQLELAVRAAGALATGWPQSHAEDHAQRAGPSARVRRTAAAEKASAQEQQSADKTLQVVIEPIPDPRVRTVQPVDATAEKPLPANETVQLVIVFPAQQ